MISRDSTREVVDALQPYFSLPIARALLTSTMRRAKIAGPEVPPHAIPDIIIALERALPMYITDPSRRGECLARLRLLAPNGASTIPRASPIPAPAPASRRIAQAERTGPSIVIQVKTADDVANVCEVGRDLACRVGFAQVQQTKIATAIAELARNILAYAEVGDVRVVGIDAPRRGIEVVAVDKGPGIADLELVMSGHYRSRTGMGMGLRGAKRLMDTFEIESCSTGTTVVMRKFVA